MCSSTWKCYSYIVNRLNSELCVPKFFSGLIDHFLPHVRGTKLMLFQHFIRVQLPVILIGKLLLQDLMWRLWSTRISASLFGMLVVRTKYISLLVYVKNWFVSYIPFLEVPVFHLLGHISCSLFIYLLRIQTQLCCLYKISKFHWLTMKLLFYGWFSFWFWKNDCCIVIWYSYSGETGMIRFLNFL